MKHIYNQQVKIFASLQAHFKLHKIDQYQQLMTNFTKPYFIEKNSFCSIC